MPIIFFKKVYTNAGNRLPADTVKVTKRVLGKTARGQLAMSISSDLIRTLGWRRGDKVAGGLITEQKGVLGFEVVTNENGYALRISKSGSGELLFGKAYGTCFPTVRGASCPHAIKGAPPKTLLVSIPSC